MLAGYSLPEVKKAVVAFIGAAAYIVGLLVLPDNANGLEFQQAAVAAVGALFGVIAVFADKNVTTDDLSKAVSALSAAALTIVGYFATVDASDTQQVAVIVGALVTVVGVYLVRNEGKGAPGTPPAA